MVILRLLSNLQNNWILEIETLEIETIAGEREVTHPVTDAEIVIIRAIMHMIALSDPGKEAPQVIEIVALILNKEDASIARELGIRPTNAKRKDQPDIAEMNTMTEEGGATLTQMQVATL